MTLESTFMGIYLNAHCQCLHLYSYHFGARYVVEMEVVMPGGHLACIFTALLACAAGPVRQ